MSRLSIPRSALQIVAIALVLLVVTGGLELLGVTHQGYGFAVAFSLVFALGWGAVKTFLGQRR